MLRQSSLFPVPSTINTSFVITNVSSFIYLLDLVVNSPRAIISEHMNTEWKLLNYWSFMCALFINVWLAMAESKMTLEFLFTRAVLCWVVIASDILWHRAKQVGSLSSRVRTAADKVSHCGHFAQTSPLLTALCTSHSWWSQSAEVKSLFVCVLHWEWVYGFECARRVFGHASPYPTALCLGFSVENECNLFWLILHLANWWRYPVILNFIFILITFLFYLMYMQPFAISFLC